MLLDEPTNHMDIEAFAGWAQWSQTRTGFVLIYDRAFS
jgi:ATPase subunit of ABC transporter with duplicated ATPase domains